MTFELDSYNLGSANLAIIKQLLYDKPSLTMARYAKELGVSTRNFYRLNVKHKLLPDGNPGRVNDRVEAAIKRLTMLGYKIEKA